MKTVVVQIDEDLCTGCALCVLACPSEILDFDEQLDRAIVLSTRNCLLCRNCESYCATEAIRVSL